jgi:hypothetical protein
LIKVYSYAPPSPWFILRLSLFYYVYMPLQFGLIKSYLIVLFPAVVAKSRSSIYF